MPKAVVHSRHLSTNDRLESILEDLFISVGGFRGRAGCGDLVLIKPNFVAPFPLATTDLAFVGFIADKIREAGAVPVVGESGGYEFDTETTFQVLGVRSFLKDRNVDLINFEEESFVLTEIGYGLPPVEIARAALEAKLIINLPVLKRHTITGMTGAVKNFFGFLSKSSRRRLHCGRLHHAVMRLASRFDNALHFVDARNLLTRAVFGETRPLNFCLAGTDPFALDHFGSMLLGIDPLSVEHLQKESSYGISGAVPDAFNRLEGNASLKTKLHRAFYSAFYLLDEVKCRALGGNTIIPQLHWVFGVHPEISAAAAPDELTRLADICPVGAVDVANKRIIKELCITCRCLKCFHERPAGPVILKGFNRPDNRTHE